MRESINRWNQKWIDELGPDFGELYDYEVTPVIWEKFDELGFGFTQSAHPCTIWEDGNPKVATVIDIILQSDNIVMAVEVRTEPDQADVDDHILRMEVLRRSTDDRQWDRRKLQGAIAGVIIDDSVRDYALKTGFYVIEQSGDTVQIRIPEGFKAREW